ncbi:probable inactive receptor kinase at4g23740 [Phtheirospermum japonicum]|uniref:Probable inactive receptor kinase at4g23740 n=1 Tax=Phtheirospermum japonicum TaxID=374723 RepID=A0A830BR16_9LAMI|nr:probable inactive receptor kinase at4g23740 [Phtheirospermum japonicum]
MSRIYSNWGRLVGAVLKKEQLWQLFHDHSRSPSVLFEASDCSSSFKSNSHIHDVDFSQLGISSWSRREPEPPMMVLISDFSPAFDVEGITLVSAYALRSETYGNGTFGGEYSVAMENGVKIVLKRLKSVNISELEFKRHMGIIGNVGHENVVALRAYYLSKDERLLLYDYFSNGSVFALLHGREDETPATYVSWDTDFELRSSTEDLGKGSVGSSYKAIFDNANTVVVKRLLRDVYVPFKELQKRLDVTGRLKHENVAELRAHYFSGDELLLVYDYQTQDSVHALLHGNKGTGRRPLDWETRLRVAPPEQKTDDGAVNSLVNWIQYGTQIKWNADVFDAALLPYNYKRESMRQSMRRLCQLAMDCVAYEPDHRPKMPQVVGILEDISGVVVGAHRPFVESLLEDLHMCIRPRLEDALEDLLEFVFNYGSLWTK